jgi:uncharacterized phiE125 gp8 family phage protein
VKYRSLTRQTGPAVEPVTLSEAKAHCRIDGNADDAYVASLITAAREWCEQYLDRTLVYTQWVMRFDRFPTSGIEAMELPRPPMAVAGTATAVSLTFTADGGTTGTYAVNQFRVDRQSTPGAVLPIYAGTWPPHRIDAGAHAVTWWAGYGASGTDVPAAIRHAMLMLVGFWYDNRSTVLVGSISKELEFAVSSLLDSQKWGSYR